MFHEERYPESHSFAARSGTPLLFGQKSKATDGPRQFEGVALAHRTRMRTPKLRVYGLSLVSM